MRVPWVWFLKLDCHSLDELATLKLRSGPNLFVRIRCIYCTALSTSVLGCLSGISHPTAPNSTFSSSSLTPDLFFPSVPQLYKWCHQNRESWLISFILSHPYSSQRILLAVSGKQIQMWLLCLLQPFHLSLSHHVPCLLIPAATSSSSLVLPLLLCSHSDPLKPIRSCHSRAHHLQGLCVLPKTETKVLSMALRSLDPD